MSDDEGNNLHAGQEYSRVAAAAVLRHADSGRVCCGTFAPCFLKDVCDMSLELYRLIPGLRLPEPVSLGPVTFCTTGHLNRYGLRNDKQLRGITMVARNSRDVQGRPSGELGVMLLPKNRKSALLHEGIPRICRDALALCFITNGTALKSYNRTASAITASDYFDIQPTLFDDDQFFIRSPGLFGFGYDTKRYTLTEPIHLPPADSHHFEHYDEPLSRALDRTVRRFLSKKLTRPLRQVFRAISMAYHATRQLHEPESTIHDLGTRLAQWISAFETLVHPGTGQVGFDDVALLIQSVDWPAVSEMHSGTRSLPIRSVGYKHFVVRPRKKKRESAVSHYYRQLYNLRNSIAHGNPLRQNDFHVFRRRERARIDLPAPLLFRECLLQRLRDLAIQQKSPEGVLTYVQFRRLIRREMEQSHFDEAFVRLLLLPIRPQRRGARKS